MYTYKLYFKENGNRSTNTVKNLDAAQEIAVAYLNNFSQMTECEIETPTGALSIVRKEVGAQHWNHPGYTFSHIEADKVAQYRRK